MHTRTTYPALILPLPDHGLGLKRRMVPFKQDFEPLKQKLRRFSESMPYFSIQSRIIVYLRKSISL